MRIQHNIPAMNAYRNYTNNTKAVSKNLEKLSSGYAINRAGDNAAGLAISEKMRAQITGLEVAQKNAKDGISLIQTAEGALTEVHSMLNRMTELAMQSANGTFDNETDRANLQKEVAQLKSEIDRISDSSNFNGIKLLDGSLSAEGSGGGGSVADGGMVAYVNGLDVVSNAATKDTFDAGATAAMQVDDGNTASFTYRNAAGDTITKSFTNNTGNSKNMADFINDDAELSQLFIGDAAEGTITSREAGSKGPKVLSIALDSTDPATTVAKTADSITGKDASITLNLPAGKTSGTFTVGDKTYEMVTNAGEAKKGNIEIIGSDIADIATALQNNGVTSAAVSGTGIEITDLSQIAVASKGPSVGIDKDSGTIYAQAATKNEYGLGTAGTVGPPAVPGTGFYVAGTANQAQTLTVSVIDENGKTKDIEVNYISSDVEADNAASILTALKNNSEINKYFDVDDVAGTMTSKTAGSDGAALAGLKTTDTAVNKKFDFTKENVGEDSKKTLELEQAGAGTTVTVNGKVYEFVNEGQTASKGNTAVTVGTDTNDSTKNLADVLKNAGVDVTYDGTNKLTFSNEGKAASGSGSGGLVLQIGESSDDYNQLTVTIGNMDTASLGIGDIDIGKQEGAKAAMDLIKTAINKVSSTRGDLGAAQNRLDHTINNLSVTQENIQDAEASIRDVDVAKEMMAYTKNNILVQSAQAMLAQANQLPQGVLQLLG